GRPGRGGGRGRPLLALRPRASHRAISGSTTSSSVTWSGVRNAKRSTPRTASGHDRTDRSATSHSRPIARHLIAKSRPHPSFAWSLRAWNARDGTSHRQRDLTGRLADPMTKPPGSVAGPFGSAGRRAAGPLNVVLWGSGDRVVCVHGSLSWGAFAFRAQRPLADTRSLVLPDRRGYGASAAAGAADFDV